MSSQQVGGPFDASSCYPVFNGTRRLVYSRTVTTRTYHPSGSQAQAPSGVVPVSRSSMPTYGDNQHAVALQNVCRGFLARRKTNRLGDLRTAKALIKDLKICFKAMKKIQKRAEESLAMQIIREPQYLECLRALQRMRDRYVVLNKELMSFSAEPDSGDRKRFLEHYTPLVNTLQGDLLTLVGKYGVMSVETLLELLVINWKGPSTDLGCASMPLYQRLFSPTGYVMCNVEEDCNRNFFLNTRTGSKIAISRRDLETGIFFMRPWNLFRPRSLYEEMHGGELYCPIYTRKGYQCVVIQGVFRHDPIHLGLDEVSLDTRRFEDVVNRNLAPQTFKNAFYENCSIRDLVIKSAREFDESLTLAYQRSEGLSRRSLMDLAESFRRANVIERTEILTLLLIGSNPDKGFSLFNIMLKEGRDSVVELKLYLPHAARKRLNFSVEKSPLVGGLPRDLKVSDDDIPGQIAASGWDDDSKAKAMARYESSKGSSGDGVKALQWVKGFLRIPVGKYSTPPVEPLPEDPGVEELRTYRALVRVRLGEAKRALERAVHGHEKPKEAFMELLVQRIRTGNSKGAVIGLQGPPGNGKTTLIKKGVAVALGRPCAFIPLGGVDEGAVLSGGRYTYIGSVWGRIAQALMDGGTMDMVIILDELDKISKSTRGQEIISYLMQITDPTQNNQCEDNYFDGLKMDFSRVIFVLSYNDSDQIHPVLRDRIVEIQTHPLTLEGKCCIARDYLMPELLEQNGFKSGDIELGDAVVEHIVHNYAREAGARKLKAKISSIVKQLGVRDCFEELSYPVVITRELVESCLGVSKVEMKKITSRPCVGVMQGLYATSGSGIGGITTIQCTKTHSEKRLELTMTGSLGDMMTESVRVARDLAWSIVPEDVRDVILQAAPFGLHIHATELGTPKDGPSAGGVITVALVSQLMGIPVRNNVASTGEVDSLGNLTQIGGLVYKLQGAKEAGINYVVISRANQRDIEEIEKTHPRLIDSVYDKAGKRLM